MCAHKVVHKLDEQLQLLHLSSFQLLDFTVPCLWVSGMACSRTQCENPRTKHLMHECNKDILERTGLISM